MGSSPVTKPLFTSSIPCSINMPNGQNDQSGNSFGALIVPAQPFVHAVWRQDHNGFLSGDPGFIDHVVNKKASIIRVYLPPDANTLLCVTDHRLRSRNKVNVIVAGKQPGFNIYPLMRLHQHCAAIGMWEWPGNDKGAEPMLSWHAAATSLRQTRRPLICFACICRH